MPFRDDADLELDAMVGSYRIAREIGRGGMGVVYEAAHAMLPRRAAVKVMHGALRRHAGMATRMVQEAGILEQIEHPGVVRVYECGILPDHRAWIAMELVGGDSLASRLHATPRLHATEVAALLAAVADVLAAVHARGVIHRDLKPDNLLLVPRDRAFPLRVIDWGVARLGAVGRLTLDGLVPGTPIYMSPEQANGKSIAAASDLYSLGVIAYEALSGEPPFDGRTLAEVVCMHLSRDAAPLEGRCDAPPALCRLVHTLLSKTPEERPCATEVRRSARAIVNALGDATSAYEEISMTPRGDRDPSVDVVDPDLLEHGVTELFAVVRAPRWTPELEPVSLQTPGGTADSARTSPACAKQRS